MSFRALLNHQCDLYDLLTVYNDGSPVTEYVKINTYPVPCRIDLNFLRQGKDSLWLDSVARPEDRTGVMFFLPSAPIKSGLRVTITKGPAGSFQLQGALDEAWGFNKISHYEVGVVEMSTLLYRSDVIQGGGNG